MQMVAVTRYLFLLRVVVASAQWRHFMEVVFLRFSWKQQYASALMFFHGLVENTCSLQPAEKQKKKHYSGSLIFLSGMLKYYQYWIGCVACVMLIDQTFNCSIRSLAL